MTTALALRPPARRTRPPVLLLLLTALTALVAVVGIPRLGGGSSAAPSGAIRNAATTGFAPLDERIEVLERRVVDGDGDYLNRTALATLLIESARTTGDPAAADRAESMVLEALANNPDHQPAETLLASIELSGHEFAVALARAEAVLAEDPMAIGALTIVGDANLELGRVAEAQEAYFELGQQAGGSPSVLVRRARLAWISGDPDGAVEESAAALDAAVVAGLGGSDLAFYQAQHVVYLVDSGRADEAVAIIEAAVDNAPSAPGVLAALAEVRTRQGDLPGAIDAIDRAIAVAPTPDLLAVAVDLRRAVGDDAIADELTATVLAIADLADATGDVANRRAIAGFLADEGIETGRAVALAEAELELRPDALSHDTLAWALLADGQAAAALAATERSLADGPIDAELLFRAGVIHAEAGAAERAAELLGQALAIDDRFDPIRAEAARSLLERLEAGR